MLFFQGMSRDELELRQMIAFVVVKLQEQGASKEEITSYVERNLEDMKQHIVDEKAKIAAKI